jgi:hypothetical protein
MLCKMERVPVIKSTLVRISPLEVGKRIFLQKKTRLRNCIKGVEHLGTILFCRGQVLIINLISQECYKKQYKLDLWAIKLCYK